MLNLLLDLDERGQMPITRGHFSHCHTLSLIGLHHVVKLKLYT